MSISAINKISFRGELEGHVQDTVNKARDKRDEVLGAAAGGTAGAAAIKGRKALQAFRATPDVFRNVANGSREAMQTAGNIADAARYIPKNKAKVATAITNWFKNLGKMKFFRPIARIAESKAVKKFSGAIGSATAVAAFITGIATMGNAAAGAFKKEKY